MVRSARGVCQPKLQHGVLCRCPRYEAAQLIHQETRPQIPRTLHPHLESSWGCGAHIGEGTSEGDQWRGPISEGARVMSARVMNVKVLMTKACVWCNECADCNWMCHEQSIPDSPARASLVQASVQASEFLSHSHVVFLFYHLFFG